MIPKDCQRLAEVDFPIAAVSRHSVRDKSIRQGHPFTLHLWWARRPLAACRAMLLGLLLPDPADPACPGEFKTQARELLARVQRGLGPTDLDLRQGLLRFIADFSNWDLAGNESYLAVARGLVRAAHGEEAPLVVDPFAGGGSIPLEALRLGCETFASDLNPVACLILKVLLEDIPRHAAVLAEDLRKVGKQVREAAAKELAEFHPEDHDGGLPVAYLWARTVVCEAPSCGCEIPLARSFWLSKKAHRRRALRFTVARPKGGRPRVDFEIFEPRSEGEVPRGTVSRAKATCPACHAVLPPERVRAQLAAQRGGADTVFDEEGRRTGGALLMAVVVLRKGESGRRYRLPAPSDYAAVRRAQERLRSIAAPPSPEGLSPVPNEPLPVVGTLGFRVQRYGMLQWCDLFTSRQILGLLWTVNKLRAGDWGGSSPARLTEILSLCASRLADISNALCQWSSSTDQVLHLFSRQAVPMLWDFAEASPRAGQAGDFSTTASNMARALDGLAGFQRTGQVVLADASTQPLPDSTADVWFTDPPYYDAIPYADLSDFFFVWLKRLLPGHPLLRDPFDPGNPLTPKGREAVQDETKVVGGLPKGPSFFEEAITRAFRESRRVLKPTGVASIVFAHKTTKGWEALLSGIVRSNWVIVASWPIATERVVRLRSQGSAALATSVHLVCRPRAEDAEVGDWSKVSRELPRRVREWMARLQAEGIRGADLVFSCIGPALEIYSRFSKVVDAEDREVPLGGDPEAAEPHLRGYLAYVWEAVGRAALEQVLAGDGSGNGGALEEDARLTALFLWTLESSAQNGAGGGSSDEDSAGGDDEEADEDGAKEKAKPGQKLIFDVVRRFAQPLGIHLDAWEGRIIETDKGVVRLLPVAERARQLFGEEGAQAAARRIEQARAESPQLSLFPEAPPEGQEVDATRARRGRRRKARTGDEAAPRGEPTTLDRVHAAMLLQRSGQSTALRTLLAAERDRGPAFERLANALSALYPEGSEEERLLDAMLLAMPR